MIKFGINSTPIDIGEWNLKCPSCEVNCQADIMVMSNYYHFYFIPIFPIGKDVNIICKNCGLKRYGASFNIKTVSTFNEIKYKFKHPWFTYIGIISFLSLLLMLIIFMIN